MLDGESELTFGGKSHVLKKGDTYYIPEGVPHSGKAMLVEPSGTINTGDMSNEMTADGNMWI